MQGWRIDLDIPDPATWHFPRGKLTHSQGGNDLPALQVILTLREKRKPIIIDADGLYITTKNLDLVKGYDLAILTPNKNEFQRLANQMEVPLEGDEAPEDPLMVITKKLEGPIIVRKGAEDRVCNGAITISNGEGGSKRRSGGQVKSSCTFGSGNTTSSTLQPCLGELWAKTSSDCWQALEHESEWGHVFSDSSLHILAVLECHTVNFIIGNMLQFAKKTAANQLLAFVACREMCSQGALQ